VTKRGWGLGRAKGVGRKACPYWCRNKRYGNRINATTKKKSLKDPDLPCCNSEDKE